MKITVYLMISYLLLLCVFAGAETYTMSNDRMSLSVEIGPDNNSAISSIKDMTTGQEFIKGINPDSPLWNFIIKKDGMPDDPHPITLFPKDAEKVTAEKTDKGYIFIYKNVKKPDMDDSFDVTCAAEQKDCNTYWDIRITPGKKYGIWEVNYPVIANIDTQNGDNFYIPSRGDVFVTEFDSPNGFPNPASQLYDSYTKHYAPVYPKFVQYSSLTKGESTLYMCSEDLKGTFRQMNWDTDAPNTMKVYTTFLPPYMGEAGHEYKPTNRYNISVFPGDWYDAAKKYRKWGIDNNYYPFSHGKIENRKDLPQWWKKHTLSMQTYFGRDRQLEDNSFRAAEYFDVPIMFQLYEWSAYAHDTHYPNWLPLRLGLKEKLNRLKSMGCQVIPYTNGHLIDTKRSETVKAYGDNGAALKTMIYNGREVHESWAEQRGAWNVQACVGTPYLDEYLKEIRRIFREYPFDALYIDQVGASSPSLCFNKDHNHPVGGGTYIQDAYIKMIKEVRKIIKEETGKDVPITTEDGADMFTFDGLLKVNECTAKSAENIVRGVIFSGYIINHGTEVYREELFAKNDWPLIHRTGDVLCKGYGLGWGGIMHDKYWDHKDAIKYLRDAARARYSAVDYFNLGEQVRPVNIVSENPTMKLTWGGPFGVREQDFHVIKTCSFHHHGKTMVCFTNCSDKVQKTKWKTTPKDMYLKEKKSYTIKETWPEKKILSKGEKIENTLEIKPLETIILVIE